MTAPLTKEEELIALCQVYGMQLMNGERLGKLRNEKDYDVSILVGAGLFLDNFNTFYRSSGGGFRYFFTSVEQALESVRKVRQ